MTLPEPDDRPPIRGGWVGRQWPLLTVLGGGVVGILTIGLDHFRAGSLLLSVSVLFAAVQIFFAFAFGACVGSLINVLVYRMPREISVVRPASRCPW